MPVTLSQLETGSPLALPIGTCSDAIAPTAVPRKNGVSTDEIAKAAPAARRPRSVLATLRKAKPEPRSTMPSAASASGMNSVDITDEKAMPKAVQETTRTKISQTWLASQTGPIECSISARGRSPRLSPPATRSQKPAPKSAPPNSA